MLACILGFYASKFLHREIALLVFTPIVISSWLRSAASVIPSIITLRSIIGHHNNEKLNVKESATLLLLSTIVIGFAYFDIFSRVKALIMLCNNPIYRDLLFAISMFSWVSLPSSLLVHSL